MTLEQLALMVQRGFEQTATDIQGLDQRIDGVEQRIDGVDQRLGRVEQGLDDLDLKLTAYVSRTQDDYERLERRVQTTEEGLDVIRKHLPVE